MKQLEAFQEYRQALALLRDAKPAEALPHILKAVELEPLDPYYLSYQGVIVAQAMQKIAEAEELCQRALRIEPRQSQLYLNLAEVYKVAGRREDACHALSRGLRYSPHDYRLHYEIGKLAVRRPPMISSLPRGHFLNRQLGRLRHYTLQYIAGI